MNTYFNRIACLLVFCVFNVGCNNDSGRQIGDGRGGSQLDISGNLYFQDSHFYQSTKDESAYSSFNINTGQLTPLVPGSGWFVSVSPTKKSYLRVDPTYSKLSVYDNSGRQLYMHDISSIGYTFKSVPRYSPDGEFIAVVVRDIYSSLMILRPNGELLNMVHFEDMERGTSDSLTSLDWLPDGRLVFALGNNLYRLLDVYNDDYEIITSEVTDEAILEVKASPQGDRIAFISGTYYSGEGDVFVFNISEDVTNPLSTGGQSHRIAWSPDGKKIAIAFGKVAAIGDCGALWIVESDLSVPVEFHRTSQNGEINATKLLYQGEQLCPVRGLDWYQ